MVARDKDEDLEDEEEEVPEGAGPKEDPSYRSGFVAIVGRPNVGKSTFLNTVLGQKVSIVTAKPQTTRNRIVGIKSLPGAQLVFLDTPGFHKPQNELGSFMVRETQQAVKDVDVVLLMVEPEPPGQRELAILRTLKEAGKPVVLAINKVDRIRKPELLPLMQQYSTAYEFNAIIPLSALKSDGIEEILAHLKGLMQPGPRLYPEDMVTDSFERFLVAELVREKVMEATEEEVPHSSAAEVMQWEEDERRITIHVNIYVEKDSQKGIIIGKRGQRLKEIGTAARSEIEGLLGTKVHLELFVKVKAGWRRSRADLKDLGFSER